MAAAVRSLHECGIAPALIQRVLIDGGPRRDATSATPEPSSSDEQRIRQTAAAGR